MHEGQYNSRGESGAAGLSGEGRQKGWWHLSLQLPSLSVVFLCSLVSHLLHSKKHKNFGPFLPWCQLPGLCAGSRTSQKFREWTTKP